MENIVQIVGYYPPHIGGMEVVAQEVSLELAKRKYPVTVLTSDIGSYSGTEKKDNYTVKRLRSVEFAHSPIIWSLPFRLLALPKGSILHVHVAHAGIPEIAFIAAKIRNFRLVIHFHLETGPSGSLGVFLPFYKKYFLTPVMRGADKIIVFSDEQSKLLREKYGVKDSRVAVIPNGVGDTFFYPDRVPAPHDPLRILYVGRLWVQKRVDRIIRAVALVKKPVELTLVGDGEDRPKLEALVKELHLENVHFKGKKYGRDLLDEYRDADIFALASDIEGMPLVLLEAMASGLPIVGSNVTGIKELISGTGILIDEPYPEQFAKAFESFIDDPAQEEHFSAQSVEKAKYYSWAKLIDRLITVYTEITTSSHDH